jgi:alanyl-tRNA synthetase
VVAIVANPDGNVAMARNGKVDINCQEILKEIENIGGKSGGRANLAQGTVPKANVKTGLDLLEDLVKLKLMADYME